MRLVREKGYTATTTKEIAQVAGVNECTLFRKFGSKKDIVLAVVLTFLCCMLFYILFLRSAKPESNDEPTVIENSYNGDSLRQDSNDVAKTDSSEKHK